MAAAPPAMAIPVPSEQFVMRPSSSRIAASNSRRVTYRSPLGIAAPHHETAIEAPRPLPEGVGPIRTCAVGRR